MSQEAALKRAYKRQENLIYKVYPCIVGFPKAEKFALCKDIKSCMFDILKNLGISIKTSKNTKYYIELAIGGVHVLFTLFNLSKYKHYISEGFFEIISTELLLIDEEISVFI